MLTKIKLLGELGRKFGRSHTFDLNTHLDAFKALGANYGDPFWNYLISASDRGVGYQVLAEVGNKEYAFVTEDTFDFPSTPTLIIAPILVGNGGFGKILAGAAIFALASPLGGLGILGLTANSFQLIGAALVLSGVSQLISPTPKTTEEEKNSFVFNDTTNVSAPGGAVPVVYGTFLVGSVVISSGITTSQIAT